MDYVSSVLMEVQHPHFRETDWSCASRKSLLIRWPPDARLMKDPFVSQHSNYRIQSRVGIESESETDAASSCWMN